MDVLVQNIKQKDIIFFGELVKRMGWAFKTKESIIENFIETRPKNVDLKDEEIIDVVRSVRYTR